MKVTLLLLLPFIDYVSLFRYFPLNLECFFFYFILKCSLKINKLDLPYLFVFCFSDGY